MLVTFEVWNEKSWFPAGPDKLETREMEGYKPEYGGFAFTEAGKIFISKGAPWKKAMYWHEKGHCLLFEAGKGGITNHTFGEEVDADSVADLMAGTYQTLGMLAYRLAKTSSTNVKGLQQRIEIILDRHKETAIPLLKKLFDMYDSMRFDDLKRKYINQGGLL